MNYFKKITIIGTSILAIGAGIYCMPTLLNKETIDLEKINKEDVYDKIETKTELKSVRFDTAEEMAAYTESITKINNLEEATTFIKQFLEDCETGKPEVMLTYYSQNLWDYVLDNNLFPFYDSTKTLTFKVTDLAVKESKDTNNYIATYTLTGIDSENGATIGVLERKDTFELFKDFEIIKITNYTRETTSEKYNDN